VVTDRPGNRANLGGTVSDQVLTVLKFCLLGLLYLFFVRVLWAVWTEVRAPVPAGRAPVSRGGGSATAPSPRPERSKRQLVVRAPAEMEGRRFDIGTELTIGRAKGCQVRLDDTYTSQLHARVFERDGDVFVDDLGSTNGTFLNDARVSGPLVVRRGDRVRVGGTILELT
jgi:hypothetical protein